MPQSAYRDLIYRHWWLGGGIALLTAVLVLSLLPLNMPSTVFTFEDKVLHLITFMILMLWFGGVVSAASLGRVFAGLLIYGAAIEGLQFMTGYRSMEFADLIADAVGLLLGWQLLRWGLGEWCSWLEQWLID